MRIVDRIHSVIADRAPSDVVLSYKKQFVGLVQNGIANNYVKMLPRKKWVIVIFRIPRSDGIDDEIDASGISTLPYDRPNRQYRVKIRDVDEVGQHRDLLSALIDAARTGREPD